MEIILSILFALVAGAAGYFWGIHRMQSRVSQLERAAIEAQTRLKAEREHSEMALRKQAEALRAEFKAVSADYVQTQSDNLRTQHIRSLEALLKPLGHNIEQFRTQFIEGNASLDRYIKSLIDQTNSLGRDAEDLAKALKSNNKLQGNWGEAVLANLLSASGLTEGRDYTLQQRSPDGKGSSAIPDVVVHLPGKRNIVIDSKASLTAYTDYVAAESPEEQQKLLKEHLRSVRQHVKELSTKDYSKLVPDSIGYVLMFIPSEGAYVTAVTAEPQLTTEAYAQHIIIVNPTNLLMALQLAYNLWQSEMQSRSVGEIYASAEKLYKKFSTFANNFVKIGNTIDQLHHTYEDAHKQLATGRGNIVSQLEGWKKKGLTPSSQLPEELLEEE